MAKSSSPETLDVICIGAGISGINAAARIQQKLPGYRYAVLEARTEMGGTWDLFRYPGIRSDSDLHTFGFAWRPWSEPQDIAPGGAIRQYIKDSAREAGIDKHVRYRHRVERAEWHSDEGRWRLDVKVGAADGSSKQIELASRWVIFCTGYYDYENPLAAVIPGLDSFTGRVVHPQFWPEDLDYTDKRVAIIGSGATAITLLPVLAQTAARVSMVQRSPAYIVSRPATSPLAAFYHRWLPAWLAWRLVRWHNIFLPFLFFRFCRRWPQAARRLLQRRTMRNLPATVRHDPHFQPNYNPWEQRMCMCPDADFFDSLKSGKGELVTGIIDTVTPQGIRVKGSSSSDNASSSDSDTFVPADILITATGLRMRIAGGAAILVDGEPVDISERFLWKGVMLQDLPNASVVMGYTNASWTLGADATALQTCRLLAEMDRLGKKEIVPRMSPAEASTIKEVPLLDLNSTYLQKGGAVLPKTGNIAPWQSRKTYMWDIIVAQFGSIRRGLHYL